MQEFFEYREKLIEKLNKEADKKHIQRVAMHNIFEHMLFPVLESIAEKNKNVFVKNPIKKVEEDDNLEYQVEIIIDYEDDGNNYEDDLYILNIKLTEYEKDYSNMWLELENFHGARPATNEADWKTLSNDEFRNKIKLLFIEMTDIELLPRP